MPTDRLQTFTDREEEVALFQKLRGRDREKPWPLLPILAFIAPGGSGKSTLIEHLIEQCSVDGAPALPYARLDFTVPSAPKDLLSILVSLRDQLWRRADREGNRLTFPRFDLGALIAQDPSTDKDLSVLTRDEVQRSLSTGRQVFEAFAAVGSTLGFLVPYLPAIVAGVRLAGKAVEQIPVVQDILGHLQDSTDWRWYRTKLGLDAKAGMKEVLLHLYELSRPGKPKREELVINELLPAAFAADLYGALVETTPPKAWTDTANVVIFLDGFEDLQSTPGTTATDLLRGLTTEPRKEGRTDPLLLVIGSRVPLTGMPKEAQRDPFARTKDEGEATAKQRMHDLYVQWQQRLKPLQYLRPEKDLVLPIRLRDFGLEHTRSYLREVGQRRQKAVFEADDLVQAIDRVTHGQPLFLALAAEAVLEAEEREQPLQPTAFELLQAPVPPERGAQEIGEYLLDLFLRQLPDAESKDLVFCAVPRVLDEAVFRVVLPSLDDIDAPERWKELRQRSFLSVVSKQRSMVHPVVRELLLRRLTVSVAPKTSFVEIHTRLKNYFTQRATSREYGPDGAEIEVAYHALALGDADPATRLGVLAQTPFRAGPIKLESPWEPLMEAVRQAPTYMLPKDTEARAWNALVQASEASASGYPTRREGGIYISILVHVRHEAQAAVTAVLLYTWLLSAAHDNPEESARLQPNLELAYSLLPPELDVFPVDRAKAQSLLGKAFTELPGGNREAHLRLAIGHYEAALLVYSSAHMDDDAQAVTNNLELAKGELQKLIQPEQITPPQQTHPGQESS